MNVISGLIIKGLPKRKKEACTSATLNNFWIACIGISILKFDEYIHRNGNSLKPDWDVASVVAIIV